MIRLNRTNNRTIDILFIFGLFVLFTMISFILVIIGSRHYRSITNQLLANHETRTAASYLFESFHENDFAGSVAITEIDGIPAISLKHTSAENASIKYIFAYDGYLRELIISEGNHISPPSGEKIIKIASLDIQSYGSHLYCFTLTDTYGNSCPIYISRSAK